AALVVEALEDVSVEVHAEGAAAGVAAMQRTRAAPLGTAAAQLARQAQLIEDAGDGQLVFQMGKVEIGALADGHRFAYAVGTGLGDYWLSRRNVRRVARGLVFR